MLTSHNAPGLKPFQHNTEPIITILENKNSFIPPSETLSFMNEANQFFFIIFQVSGGASDSDSACSGDLSNTTDSGRGSHGSNDDDVFHETAGSSHKKSGGKSNDQDSCPSNLYPPLRSGHQTCVILTSILHLSILH